MDEKVIERFETYKTEDKTPNKTHKTLPNLTNSEQKVYDDLCSDRYGESFRLEQEKLDFDYVTKELLSMYMT